MDTIFSFGHAMAIVRHELDSAAQPPKAAVRFELHPEAQLTLQQTRNRWQKLSSNATTSVSFPGPQNPSRQALEDYFMSTFMSTPDDCDCQELFEGMVLDFERFQEIAGIWRDFSDMNDKIAQKMNEEDQP